MLQFSARFALAACSALTLGLAPLSVAAKPAKPTTTAEVSDIPAKWEAPVPATITTSAR